MSDVAETDSAKVPESPEVVDVVEVEGSDVEPARPAWWRRQVAKYEFTGMVFAVIFMLLSGTPSLLPRGSFFQGVVTGASAAVGYAVGVFVAWLARFLISRPTRWNQPKAPMWIALGVAALIGVIFMLYGFSQWQNEIRDLMGVEHLRGWDYPIALVVAIVVFALLMAIGRGWAWLMRRLSHVGGRWLPPRIAGAIAAVIVVVLTIFVLNGVVAEYGMKALNSSFAELNNETTADSAPPTSPLRSGGPESLVSWDSLGRQGRIFVSNGPTVEQLTEFNGTPAMEPIRVFSGLESADNLRESAELAAQELERAGGLQRKVVAIASTTGTGWINRATVDSLEYMYNGDIATVSMQYSYLPSWISFLVDKERARQAGQALFEAVDKRIRALPEAQRPKVVVFGESLGSFGAESAFGTIPDIAARTDGALFSGPTFNNSLWRDTTRDRDEGSPERLPIYDNGTQVRFAAEAQTDLSRPSGQWGDSRIVYLQHASDPIIWWSPGLILNEPDWLKEPRGNDVLSATHWIPFVTFLQVSADMAVSTGVPDGHGHTYLSDIPYAWAEILRPAGWTPEKTAKLVPLLRRD